jgi:NADH dehydrogenase/NADH:ubiquinone oxidoreductase subunit G
MHYGLPAEIQGSQKSITGARMISITINSKKIRARKSETVLQIAERSGIRIPKLCSHKTLSPYGGCRLCIVEVRGRENPLTACTLYPEAGMIIKTDTPRLQKLRKFTLQLILSEHPNACLVCERESDCANFQECIKKSAVTFGCKSCSQNEQCELQDLAREFNIKDIPFDFHYRNLEVERNDPFFDRDYNLCILCGRCIRACQEIRHAHTLEFHHRGPKTMVGTAFDLPHLESGCQFCGACVDICPTGALRDRFSRYEKPPERAVKTTCLLCSIGCSLNLNVSSNKIICTTPNNNQICVRGRFGIAPLVNHPKRITKPLMKKDGQLVEVEWEEALKCVAQNLKENKGHTGIIFSPQMTSEAIDRAYSIGDSLNAKITAPMLIHGAGGSLKMDRIQGRIAFIVVNTDMVADFSVLFLKLRKRFKNKALFIIVNAIGNMSARWADVILKPEPGTELDLVKALTGQNKTSNKYGIAATDIMKVRSMLDNRKIYLLYNATNFHGTDLGKAVKEMPLYSQPNSAKVAKSGLDDTYEKILDNKSIDCLYLIGSAPKLSREYKKIIVQDCFMPDYDCDVFLPAATFAETSGSIIDIEGKKKRVQKAIEPAGKSQPDDWIFDTLAQMMNIEPGKGKNRKNIRKGKHVTRIKPSRAFPVQLMLRENTYRYRGKSLSSILKGFGRLRRDQHVWMNEKTAKKHELSEGKITRITGSHFTLAMPVKIDPDIPDHAVLIYSHPSMGYIEREPVKLECIR